MDALIKKVYTDVNFSSAAYSGIDSVLAEVRKHDPSVTKKDVVSFFNRNRTYSLHRPIRRNFKTRKTYAFGLYENMQCDLMDLQKFASVKGNEGMKWLLVCVDVLSKRVFAQPLKNKGTIEVKRGFLKIFEEMGEKPKLLYSDQGLEFESEAIGSEFFEKQLKIRKFASSYNEKKASVCERMNRTIRGRLSKYMTEKGVKVWVPIIQDIIRGINHTKSRAIFNMRPIDVTHENAAELVNKLFADDILSQPNKKKPKFEEKQTVRSVLRKENYQRGYHIGFSDKTYTVDKVIKSNPIVYTLKDGDKKLDGRYYNEELGRFDVSDETEWRVEILKTRKRGKRVEHFVHWIGFGDENNSWISAEDMAN